MNLVQHSSVLQPSLAAVITGETEGVKGTVARQLQVQVRAKGKQEANLVCLTRQPVTSQQITRVTSRNLTSIFSQLLIRA